LLQAATDRAVNSGADTRDTTANSKFQFITSINSLSLITLLAKSNRYDGCSNEICFMYMACKLRQKPPH